MILIDDFPFELTPTEVDEWQIILFHAGTWMGPTSPEIEAARLQGLKDAWNKNGRRELGSRLMKQQHPMSRATKLTEEHKENIAKGMRGNQNKTGKRGGNQYTNPKN